MDDPHVGVFSSTLASLWRRIRYRTLLTILAVSTAALWPSLWLVAYDDDQCGEAHFIYEGGYDIQRTYVCDDFLIAEPVYHVADLYLDGQHIPHRSTIEFDQLPATVSVYIDFLHATPTDRTADHLRMVQVFWHNEAENQFINNDFLGHNYLEESGEVTFYEPGTYTLFAWIRHTVAKHLVNRSYVTRFTVVDRSASEDEGLNPNPPADEPVDEAGQDGVEEEEEVAEEELSPEEEVVPETEAEVLPEEGFDTATSSFSSVLFLPGIQASRLYTEGSFGSENQLWTPNWNTDVRKLSMSEAGVSDHLVYTRDILDQVLGLGSVYGRYAAHMDGLVADGQMAAWQPYAYDWRYAVDDIARAGTQYQAGVRSAVALVEALAADSFTDQVTIIAHSNGGLLAKALMTELAQRGQADLVDRIVLLATPQLGTPKAIGTVLHGFDQSAGGGFIIDASVARSVINNLPGAYGLLPTPEYFVRTGSSPVVFSGGAATEKFTAAYGPRLNSYHALQQFMTAELDQRPAATTVYEAGVANTTQLRAAFDLHSSILQPWRAPAGVSVIEVVGFGLPTISGFEFRQYRQQVCEEDFLTQTCRVDTIYKPVPVFSFAGDETVMQVSAAGYEGEKATYYFDLAKQENIEVIRHVNFTEAAAVHELLTRILAGESGTGIPFITPTPAVPSPRYTLLSLHSPATLRVTNGAGQVAAVVPGAGDFMEKRETIPGSSVYQLGSTTYLVVPAAAEYDIEVRGTGPGVLTLAVDAITDTGVLPQYEVWLPAVEAGTAVYTRLVGGELQTVALDYDGDGTVDTMVDPVPGETVEVSPPLAVVVAPLSPRSAGGTVLPRPVAVVAGVSTTTDAEAAYYAELYRLLTVLQGILNEYEKLLSK